MKMINSKEYIREVLKDRKAQAIKENRILMKEKKEQEEEENKKSAALEEMVQRQALPTRYNKFITSVKEEFLGECVYSLFNQSLNIFDRRNEKQEYVKKSLVKNFIQEQGADVLLARFRKQNALLSEYALIVDTAVKAVAESSTVHNINSWTIDSDVKDRFVSDLEKCNSKEAIITITDRVTDAETDFVNDNIRKKIEIDAILKSKQEKIDSMEGKPEEVKESVAASYDRKIKALKNRRVSSVYQVLAESMTKNALTDKDLKTIYVKEGNLDMDTLLEDVGIMYTFLETIYTTEMVNEEYIKEFVNRV